MSKNLTELAEEIAANAQEYIDEKHSSLNLMKAALNDFKSVGGMSGAVQFMTTGKMSEVQITKAKLMIAKVLAVISRQE